MESLKLKITLPIAAQKLYKAWLSSKQHTAFSGGDAVITSKLNEEFTAWGGYITGKNLELIPNKKIVQTWRTAEFKADAPCCSCI